jgi:hypothetical protein
VEKGEEKVKTQIKLELEMVQADREEGEKDFDFCFYQLISQRTANLCINFQTLRPAHLPPPKELQVAPAAIITTARRRPAAAAETSEHPFGDFQYFIPFQPAKQTTIDPST